LSNKLSSVEKDEFTSLRNYAALAIFLTIDKVGFRGPGENRLGGVID